MTVEDTPSAPQTDSLPAGLAALVARAGSAKGPAPVETWEPPFCGDIDMRIAADGSWHYMGSPIGRDALVRLFASVLRKDADGATYLVTPVEKCRIRVDDAAFNAVELHADGAGLDRRLTLRTNVGDVVTVDADHALRFVLDAGTQGLKPYVRVRGRLEARLTRAVTHELLAGLEEQDLDGMTWLGIWSSGMFFPVTIGELS